MRLIEVEKSYCWDGELTGKVLAVMRMFGLDRERVNESEVKHRLSVVIEDGDICFLTGPSGGGKSVLLGEMVRQFDAGEAVCLEDIDLDTGASLVDCLSGSIGEALRLLGKVGLGEARCALCRGIHLSEGQKWRYRLAKAFDSGCRVIFADEFCSNLDRLTAAVVAFNAARFARENGITLIVASSNDDVMAEMLPDVVVIKQLQGEAEVIYRDTTRES